MNPQGEVYRAILEEVCARSRVAVVLADGGGRTLWANDLAVRGFPGAANVGSDFDDALDASTRLEPSRSESPGLEPLPATSQLRRATNGSIYRHFRLALDESGPGHVLHCLLDVSDEKRLEETFLLNLQQLKSMKEIVDILYESLSTPEVVYLCLVAVTAQLGFGFNRAFFLQVSGRRMRGRIGIGPSNPDEAHEIWSRLASLNYSSLREIYQSVSQKGCVPDPRTQELASRLDFDLGGQPAEPAGATGGGPPGILGVLARGKPAKLRASDRGTDVDRALFSLLATDEVAVVPLFVRGELAGVIIADNLINRKPITEGDLNVLKTFARYAGVALERSHLYDQLRESVAKLQAANETLKQSQQKLLQAEKLSAIGELSAYVSHEIRNPLVAIGGLARSLLKDRVGDPDTAETLQIIVSQVTRLEKFLTETLDFVKPMAAGAVPTNLIEVVRECLATFKNELAEHAVEIEARMPSADVMCLSDPDLLRHALSNLIKNSIEAMAGGGKLLAEVRSNGAMVTIRIGDSGSGVPAEARSRIFDPFFTTKPEGTGLGLSIASQNIRGLGGSLELEPESSGRAAYKTVFKLTLPVAMGEETATRMHRESPCREPLAACGGSLS